MKHLRKLFISLSVIFALTVVTLPEVHSQCPMCRMSAESNLKEGGSAGKGLNKGIFVLLFTPYLVVGAIGYAWYRNHKNKHKADD